MRKFFAFVAVVFVFAFSGCESHGSDDWCESGNPAKQHHATNCEKEA